MNVQIGSRSRSWPAVALSTLVAIVGLLVAPLLAVSQEDEGAAGIAGTYTVTIAAEDVPPGLATGAALNGRWVLTLGDDGAFQLARTDVGEVAAGTYEAGPATLDLTAWSGLIGCGPSADDSPAATYAWRRSDDRLTLTPIADTCPERLTLLTAHDFGNLDVCDTPQQATFDPFAIAQQGTPAAGPETGQGVAAQEGYGEGSEVEAAIDEVLQLANGCWAAADAEQFMALHSQGVVAQIGIMGPPEQFARELQAFMDAPLRLERIGSVQLDDPNHAWAYVEVDLEGQRNPQRMNFVLEQGTWLFDTFFLFGPALPGGPGMSLP